jgi:hypothetical protein
MKRTFILILLLLISLLNANSLIDVYHKDYGVIDRTVLVFDTKPKYEIFKHESDIQINLLECRKDASIQKLDINNNKVITGFDNLVSEDKVMFIININATQLLVTGEIYEVERMELQGDVFKLVFDIFISTNPQSLFELTSYASFYKTIGNLELANEYNNKVLKFHNKLKTQQKITETITKRESIKVTTNKLKISVQKLTSKLNIKLIGIILSTIILLAIIIFLIYKLIYKKAAASDKDKNNLRPTDGFADSTYLEEVAKKLAAKNWKVEEIAKELEISLEEAQKFISPDLELEMERL